MIFVLSLDKIIQNHIQTKINVSNEMNHGNENNGFPLVCLMENGHSVLGAQSNVLNLGFKLT